jgi:PAS domain S-box-containing protein
MLYHKGSSLGVPIVDYIELVSKRNMEDLYTALALLTTGVALAMGYISLFIGVKRNNKTQLIFGVMGLCLVIFFLIPPTGFILHDHAPYPTNILVKRIFIFAYYALVPWFIWSYTGYKSKIIPYLISVESVFTYIVMITEADDLTKPIWSKISVVAFGAIFIYGLLAGIWQYRNRNPQKAVWLITSILIYGVLFLATTINQLTDNFFGLQLGMKLFFPIHFHSILFMMIMGLEVVAEVLEKNKLERKLKSQDKRWHSFMQHAALLVLELDQKGNIGYINDFGVKLLGYSTPTELLQKNWFDHFLPPEDMATTKNLFKLLLAKEGMTPYFKNSIVDKKGKVLAINWVNFLTYTDEGEVLGVMSVGCDITSEESSQRLISQLRLELEKENVTNPDVSFTNAVHTEIIGASKALRYATQKVEQVATTSAPVLLEGETGVGKEVLADLIQKLSLRNNMPFIKVNCGGLPHELIEDELFGHEKGAFTSAIQSRKGRFELADGGTIFLDEIGELPLAMQPKLLRVLQNGEFERVGGQKTIKVDVRVIAATNRELANEVKQGRFRDDLFYRLNVFPITIPPLRKRKEDLPELINYFIERKSKEYNKNIEQISKADLQRLMEYGWPGNVRELKNVIERSVIASEGKTIKLDWFFNRKTEKIEGTETLEQIERDHIVKIMNECQWRINGEQGAAEKLNMHPNTLRSRMKKLGLSRPIKDVIIDDNV